MRIVRLPTAGMSRTGVVGFMIAAALTACGGSEPSNTDAATPSAAAVTGGAAARGGRFDQAEMQKIRDCLSAAGISMPTPSGGLRTFNPSDRPSDLSARPRPSGSPSGGFRGEGRGLFSDPEVRAALEACGITLPTGRPTGSPTGSRTG